MHIAIIILNWNGRKLLQECLPHVISHSKLSNAKHSYRIWIADNASTDDSIPFVQAEFEQEVSILQLDKNYGFAEGYNRAIAEIECDIAILLNSDAYPLSPWLDPLIERFDLDPKLGALMPKIKDAKNPQAFEYAGAAGGFVDVLGFPYCSGRARSSVAMDTGQYNTAIPVLWASGAAMLVRKSVFLECGGLDADFFAHMEEIDLCWRIWRNGYTIICEPQSEIYHIGGASLNASNPRKTYYNFRNNLALIWKHWTTTELICKLLPRLIIDGLIGIIWLLQGKGAHTWAIVKGHNHFFRSIRLWQSKRKQLNHLSKQLPDGLIQGSVFTAKA